MKNVLKELDNLKRVRECEIESKKMSILTKDLTREININKFKDINIILNSCIERVQSKIGNTKGMQTELDLGDKFERFKSLEYETDDKKIYVITESHEIYEKIKKYEYKSSSLINWNDINLTHGDKIEVEVTINKKIYRLLFKKDTSNIFSQKSIWGIQYSNSPQLLKPTNTVAIDASNLISIYNVSEEWLICFDVKRFRTHYHLNDVYIEEAREILDKGVDLPNEYKLKITPALSILKTKKRFEPTYIQKNKKGILRHCEISEKRIEQFDIKTHIKINESNKKQSRIVITPNDEIINSFIEMHTENPKVNPHTGQLDS